MGYEDIKGSKCCRCCFLSSFPPAPSIVSGVPAHSVNVQRNVEKMAYRPLASCSVFP